MRDIAIVMLFASGAVMALRRPYIAALLWVWVGLMNPHRLGWGFAYSLPLAMIAAGTLFFSMLINPAQVRWTMRFPVPLLLTFVGWMGITTALAVFPDESFEKYIFVLKVLLMLLPVAAVIHTREEILGFIVVVTGSLAFFGIKGGIFTALTGGGSRVWGPPASVIEGNNELAVALIITVPLLYYLATQSALLRGLPFISKIPEKWSKRFLYSAMFLCLLSALGSHSRGALLAMIAMGSVLWWRSKSKLALFVVAMVVGVMAVAFMPEEWTSRMNTIQTYEEDDSAQGRINAWTMAVNIANGNPTGAGFVTDSPIIYQKYAPNPNFVIVAHSIYFQVLGEHGYIGLFLYLAFWAATYSLAGRLSRLSAGHEQLEWAHTLASMTKVSLIGFCVGGAFLSLAYWDMPYYIFVILLCTERCVQEALNQSSKVAPKAKDIMPKQRPSNAMSTQRGQDAPLC